MTATTFLSDFWLRLSGSNGTGRTWVFSTSFFYSPSVLGSSASDLAKGSLHLAIASGKILGFKDFLLTLRPASYPGNSLVSKLWEKLQGCRWPRRGNSTQNARAVVHTCTGKENMTSMSLSTFKLLDLTATYQAYLAAKALLVSYQNLIICSPGKGPFLGGTSASTQDTRPWHVSSQQYLPAPGYPSLQCGSD